MVEIEARLSIWNTHTLKKDYGIAVQENKQVVKDTNEKNA